MPKGKVGDVPETGSEPTDQELDPCNSLRAISFSAVAQQRHKITHNRVALGGQESVSGVTGGGGPRDQPGEPTHAHLHHR